MFIEYRVPEAASSLCCSIIKLKQQKIWLVASIELEVDEIRFCVPVKISACVNYTHIKINCIIPAIQSVNAPAHWRIEKQD